MTDVRLYQTDDGGEIDIVNGQILLSKDGLETAAYLSLWGGNEDDGGGTADERRQWWANFQEPDPSRRYRSETQSLLRSIPLIPANLRRLEEAAGRDLAWFTDSKLATAVAVRATMPALNTVHFDVKIEIDGRVFPFEFTGPSAQAG